MSLRHSPEGKIDSKILRAVSVAIRSIEKLTEAIEEFDIGKDDAGFLASAVSDLWTILYSNGYTIDVETNRLRRGRNDH